MDQQTEAHQIDNSIDKYSDVDPRTLGILFGIKLISEAKGEDTWSEFSKKQDFEDWFDNILERYDLMDEWNMIHEPRKDRLIEIFNTLEEYRLQGEDVEHGKFSTLSELLNQGNSNFYRLPNGLITIIQSVIRNHQGQLLISGSAASSLLEVPYIEGRPATTIGEIHPVINRLAQEVIEDYQNNPIHFLEVDETYLYPVIMCFPQFGMKHSEPEIIENFELANRGRGKRSKRTDAEILWVEKSYRLLPENGQLIILLTDGFLSNASIKFAREWVIDRFKIESVFSLPISTFRPQSSVKTSLVCLRKSSTPPTEYNIFMAELEKFELIDTSEVIDAYQTFLQRDTV